MRVLAAGPVDQLRQLAAVDAARRATSTKTLRTSSATLKRTLRPPRDDDGARQAAAGHAPELLPQAGQPEATQHADHRGGQRHVAQVAGEAVLGERRRQSPCAPSSRRRATSTVQDADDRGRVRIACTTAHTAPP